MSDGAPLTGEHPVLDLVNTRPAGGEDWLGTPERLGAWLALESARLPEAPAGEIPGPADLPPVHAVRADTEAVLRALLGGGRPPAAALRGLTEAQRAAPPVRELGWAEGALTAAVRRRGPLGVRLAALLAESAAGLLGGPAIGGLRECEAEDCRMLFLPAHPRRRWCSPARCGNRARVARYYRRHK